MLFTHLIDIAMTQLLFTELILHIASFLGKLSHELLIFILHSSEYTFAASFLILQTLL